MNDNRSYYHQLQWSTEQKVHHARTQAATPSPTLFAEYRRENTTFSTEIADFEVK